MKSKGRLARPLILENVNVIMYISTIEFNDVFHAGYEIDAKMLIGLNQNFKKIQLFYGFNKLHYNSGKHH